MNLSSLQRDCLIVLSGAAEQLSLDEIENELEEYHGSLDIGRIISNLETLVEEELVLKVSSTEHGVLLYKLSESGREAIEQRREWENNRTDSVL